MKSYVYVETIGLAKAVDYRQAQNAARVDSNTG